MWALQIKYLKFRLAMPEDLAWFPVLLFFKRRNKVRWAPLWSTQICQHASPGGRNFLDLLFTFIYFFKTISRPSVWCHLTSDCVLTLQTKIGFTGVLIGAKFCLYFSTSALQQMTRAKPDWGTFSSMLALLDFQQVNHGLLSKASSSLRL